MLKAPLRPRLILNYHPSSLHKKIQGFFQVKKQQPIFIKYFGGEFDNQIQTLIDFKISRLIDSWIDHEHIHCSVIQKTYFKNELKIFEAFYYFPYKKSIPFRERIYFFYPNLLSTKKIIIFQMEILKSPQNKNKNLKDSFEKIENFYIEKFTYKKNLSRCIIFWCLKLSKNNLHQKQPIFLGELVNGGCSIFSFIASEFLDVKDDLLLSEYSLWVNDRGYENGRNIKYGNLEKISYKMERVSTTNHLACTIRGINIKYK